MRYWEIVLVSDVLRGFPVPFDPFTDGDG